MRRRVVLLALLATSLVVGAGAFTSVATDRGVAVDVVSDENAYLSLTEYYSVASPAGEVERPQEDEVNTLAVDGSEGTIFEVTNQFSTDLYAVSANAESRHDDLSVTIRDEHTPGSLDVGESDEVRAEFECDALVRKATVDVTVSVAGDGVEATRYDKTVTVSCVGTPRSVAQHYPKGTFSTPDERGEKGEGEENGERGEKGEGEENGERGEKGEGEENGERGEKGEGEENSD